MQFSLKNLKSAGFFITSLAFSTLAMAQQEIKIGVLYPLTGRLHRQARSLKAPSN